MELSNREFWGLIHGLVLGSFFLLAFAGGLAELYGLRRRWNTDEGITTRVRRLTVGYWVMAGAAWATVVTGTWIVYPWYREKLAGDDLAAGCAGLQLPEPGKCSPRDFLLSNVSGDTESWHTFAFEWKEHVAWIAPMLATSAAVIIAVYGRRLADAPRVRRVAVSMFILAFATAAVAGILGALVTKIAPVK
jgi:hypothetical protein